MASADMTVTFLGPLSAAEEALVSIFGEDADKGPVRRAPKYMLDLIKHWPGRTDEACDIALNLPPELFDIERATLAQTTSALVVTCCLVTVIHEGKAIGRALRTNAFGLNAIAMWEEKWIAHQVAKLRAN